LLLTSVVRRLLTVLGLSVLLWSATLWVLAS
jgi:hypothetical protein